MRYRGLTGAAALACAAALSGCGRDRGAAADPAAGPAVVFENVAAQTGIDFRVTHEKPILSILDTVGHGAAMIDFDQDGLLDLVFAAKDQVRLYRNAGGLRFQDATAGSGFRQEGFWGGIAAGDYDNDGKPDLYLCGYDCSALYHNEGGGRFREVTAGSGLGVKKPAPMKCPEWRTSAGWVDYDGDGRPDLFVCRYAEFGPGTVELCSDPTKGEKYSCSPDIYKPQRPSLYRNLGGGRFREVTAEAGIRESHGRSLGVAFGDYNDDGRPDIAVANDERPGDLFTNRGSRFTNDGPRSGTALSALGRVHGGMGLDWGDFNGDGKLDLFVSTYENEAKNLYQNLGGGLFTDKALDAGLSEKMDRYVSWGTKFLDYDLDGMPDLVVTSGHVMNNTDRLYPGTSYPQPIQLFQNQSGRYEETTSQMSALAQKPVVGRALCLGDLDNDGRPDLVISSLEGAPIVLHNRVRNGNHWISLRLKGTRSGRDALGAWVRVATESGTQVREAYNAGSYMASSDSRMLFGIGGAAKVDSVEVRWPSGERRTLRNLAGDQAYEIVEGSGEAVARR